MTAVRTLRRALWAAAGVAALLFAILVLSTAMPSPQPGRAVERGGPVADTADWTLTDHRGRPFTAADLNAGTGPTLLVFGFTHCPDVCPTSLSYVANVLEAIGPAADSLRPLFMTVDPERDTVPVMADYVALFDRRIVGLTGTPDETAKAARDLGVYVRKVPQEGGGYGVDHTATMLLLDRDGRVRSTLDIHEKPQVAVEKVKLLLGDEGRPVSKS
ncbi:SCO family protein [Azospirillum sp. ST 5-10]|uniref:SCO family protein n=1 Tax=unclassified Azospirillum TaxID=2630922 RepID=UPI003F4A84DC